jgi:predicted transcriptional regulator of viral defense system
LPVNLKPATFMTKADEALRLVQQIGGVVRPRDLSGHGIAPVYLRRLLLSRRLVQSARGLYRLAEHRPSAHHGLAEAAKRVPRGVVCLFSASAYHRMSKEAPPEVWMAIDRKARLPAVGDLHIRFVRFSGAALHEGVEEHFVEGVPVRVTTAAKTVADLFKYRNKIGLQPALDALRNCLRKQQCPMDELWRFAIVCRVETVLRPYFEALA